jgi:hypothetical protein
VEVTQRAPVYVMSVDHRLNSVIGSIQSPIARAPLYARSPSPPSSRKSKYQAQDNAEWLRQHGKGLFSLFGTANPR